LFALTICLLAGCGGGTGAGQAGDAGQAGAGSGAAGQAAPSSAKPPISTEPVTLTVLGSPNQLYQDLLLDPVKTKYPNISIEYVNIGKGTDMASMIAAGTIPDLFTGWTGQMAQLNEMDIFFDITPLAKQMNIDLGRFEPVILVSIRASGKDNALYGLPFNVQLNATYYNRDIFDKFGVPYPKDGMTWDDAVELGKKVTREDGGTQYRGLDQEAFSRIFYPRSLNMVDPKTLTAHVNTDSWKKVLETGYKIQTIPGNMRKPSTNAIDQFEQKRVLAMMTTINRIPNMVDAGKEGLNWDVAQFPAYDDLPNQYGMVDPWIIFPIKTTKHKEAAMQVIDVVTSKEVQLKMARATAKMSPLKDPQLKLELGADIPELKDKHLQSIFKSHPGLNPSFSKYYGPAQTIIKNNMWDYIQGKKDLNTAQRDAQDGITKLVNDGEGR
jgi:multiple sugar transport system substrate-binding protein